MTSATTAPAEEADLTLRMTPEMVAGGFDKQILPRFGFKHRIRITPVTEGEATMTLLPDGDGVFVFREVDGGDVMLDTGGDARGETFLEWMQSEPGRAAIESYAEDGRQLYVTRVEVEEVVIEEVFEGDTENGSDLAILHCGRCHVVDERNRMGGIGSTPSFAALRGRENWSDLFRAFYTQNPHPSFTQVDGVTAPFDPMKTVHVAPVKITIDEVEAITSFVATIEPKDLGRPVQAN